jgi:hypothetical protein
MMKARSTQLLLVLAGLLEACDPGYRAVPLPAPSSASRTLAGEQTVYARDGLEIRAWPAFTLLCSGTLPLQISASSTERAWTVSLSAVTDTFGVSLGRFEPVELTVRPGAGTLNGNFTVAAGGDCPLRRLPRTWQAHLRITGDSGGQDSVVVRFRRVI